MPGTKPPKRHLQHTVAARVSPAEAELIRETAADRSRSEGRRITPSALIRRIVMRELSREQLVRHVF
jgi:hypothetical protein